MTQQIIKFIYMIHQIFMHHSEILVNCSNYFGDLFGSQGSH